MLHRFIVLDKSIENVGVFVFKMLCESFPYVTTRGPSDKMHHTSWLFGQKYATDAYLFLLRSLNDDLVTCLGTLPVETLPIGQCYG